MTTVDCRCKPHPVIVADFTGTTVTITRRHWGTRTDPKTGQRHPGCGRPDEHIDPARYTSTTRWGARR